MSGSKAEGPDPLEVYSFSTALLVAVMIAWTTLGHKLSERSKLVGEGSAACLMGLAVGLLLLVFESLFHPDVLQSILQFDPENFFIFFLPPIIFFAGLSVKKKHFFRNFFTIGGYGIVGTYICFALISVCLYWFVGHLLSFGDCLALGAILAATDSVAALQVISQDRFPLLYSMVFGEGVINDATSIVILGTLMDLRIETVKELTAGVVMRILGEFLYLFVASALLGAVFGFFTAFCLRKMHLHHTAQEVALIGMTAYLSYLVGDVLHLSGILSLFVSAVCISHYALHNISPQSRTTTIYSFQTLSYISEGIIFVYCGMDALDPLKWKNTDIKELLWMFWILIILLVVTRAIFVVPISLLHNRFAQKKLERREIVVIWWAGLMRGAVSVALVYYYFDPHGTTSDKHTSTMITTTLIVVLISIIAFGAATKPLLEHIMGPMEPPSAHASKSGIVELATPTCRQLGGNEYHALQEEASPRGSTDGQEAHAGGTAGESSPAASLRGQTSLPAQVPVYQDDDFSPLEGATTAPANLQEVSVDPSPRSMTGAGASGSPTKQKLISGFKDIVGRSNKSKSGGADEDFLFEFEALVRGKEASANSEAFQVVADSSHAAAPPAPQPVRVPRDDAGGEAAGLLRKESSGNDFEPNSKALLARVNRWWKALDEKHLQPVFGGPAAAAAAAQTSRGAGPINVPASSRRG